MKNPVKRRRIILAAAVVAVMAAAAVTAAVLLGAGFFYPVGPVLGQAEIEEIFGDTAVNDRRVIMCADAGGFLYGGQLHRTDAVPFFDDAGFACYPLNTLADIYGAEIEKSSKYPIIRLTNRNGETSYLVLETNLVIYGSEVFFTDLKTVERDGSYYTEADTAAKVLGVLCAKAYPHGIVKFNATGVSESDIETAQALLPAAPGTTGKLVQIEEAAAALQAGYDEVLAYAHARGLYRSDSSGHLTAYIVNDKNQLSEDRLSEGITLPPDIFYIEGYGGDENSLYTRTAQGMEAVSPSPDILADTLTNGLKAAYWVCKYHTDVLQDDMGGTLEWLRTAIADPAQYDPALYDSLPRAENAADGSWSELYSAAQPGDVLVCNRADNTLYGYSNHSAVVLEKLPGETLHLVHARSAEYGVGADDPELDYLNTETLEANTYWQKTDKITLYQYRNLTDGQREKIAAYGMEHFKGYTFGYYHLLGMKQVTCAELVKMTYSAAGIEIGPSEEDMLVSLFANDIKGAVYLPDDIMLSDEFAMCAFWKR